MTTNLLASREAAARLGISTLTLYDWLSQSDAGAFVIRGKATTIHYLQGGRKGQGRIKIAEPEVNRILSLMIASPRQREARKTPQTRRSLQHITTKPGRPDD